MMNDEYSAIAACQAGNLQAFDVLYTQYVHRIYGFLYRRTLHRQTAEDLTSTTFLKALEKIATFRPEQAAFSTWLYSIARNTLTDFYRTSRPTQDIADVWELPGDDEALRSAETAVDISATHKALATLENDKRELLILRLWDGLSYAEIAELTGKSEGSLKVAFCRVIDGLRQQVSPAVFCFLISSSFL